MEVPECALNRRSSTVLVRIMDVCDHCNRREVRALLLDESDELRVSYCGVCSKVAPFGQDCHPVKRKERRQFNKWKKASFYSASWLLLLVGGLSPTSAGIIPVKPSSLSFEAARAANHALEYADEFVKTYIRNDKNMDWQYILTNFTQRYNNFEHLPWFEKEMLPACKKFPFEADDSCLNSVFTDMDGNKKADLQQKLYKGLNYVTASFKAMADWKHKEANIKSLNKKMSMTIVDLKYLLYRSKDNLKLLNIYDESLDTINETELPIYRVAGEEILQDWQIVAAVFRETINFVQYYSQVYNRIMKENDSFNILISVFESTKY